VETFIRIGLVISFYAFSATALVTHTYAEEYYRYRDPYGRLVISNKTPPPGSTIVKKYELPEVPRAEVEQPQESAGQQQAEDSEARREQPKNK
jgi:hypothetical protein